jgi:hypothetical protein
MPTSTASSQSTDDTPSVSQIDQLEPDRIRVIEIEDKTSGNVVRRDCYDPNGHLENGDLDGVRSVFTLQDGEVYVCAIDWARSSSLDPSIELHWVATGMRVEDIDRIRIFTWPEGDLSQVFKHME